jgi:hypothetical protein
MLYTNVNGTWKQVRNISVNVGGGYKQVPQIYVNVNGTWNLCFHLVGNREVGVSVVLNAEAGLSKELCVVKETTVLTGPTPFVVL